jgi:hypothetical protein
MKWIGQNIYDLISRFRDDVYLEDISSGTIASGSNLGLDSNNKIVKATTKYMTHHNFNDDIDTTKIYLGLADADSEQSATTNIDMPLVFPTASKLLRVVLRASSNLSGNTLTWRLETQAPGVTFGTGPSIVGTQSGAGPTNTSVVTYDFTSSLDSGDNLIAAGDAVYLSIQSNASTSATKFYVSCIWEVDFGSI